MKKKLNRKFFGVAAALLLCLLGLAFYLTTKRGLLAPEVLPVSGPDGAVVRENKIGNSPGPGNVELGRKIAALKKEAVDIEQKLKQVESELKSYDNFIAQAGAQAEQDAEVQRLQTEFKKAQSELNSAVDAHPSIVAINSNRAALHQQKLALSVEMGENVHSNKAVLKVYGKTMGDTESESVRKLVAETTRLTKDLKKGAALDAGTIQAIEEANDRYQKESEAIRGKWQKAALLQHAAYREAFTNMWNAYWAMDKAEEEFPAKLQAAKTGLKLHDPVLSKMNTDALAINNLMQRKKSALIEGMLATNKAANEAVVGEYQALSDQLNALGTKISELENRQIIVIRN